MKEIRVRFAPSPTGELHIGGARTALFNWLFARHNRGKMILRIDDTDRERSKEEHLKSIINSLSWLGLNWDEGPGKEGEYGPYVQSERLAIYKEETKKLLEGGKAYPCFCTVEELEEQKEILRKQGKPPRYSGKCRHLTKEEREKRVAGGQKYVIRLLLPPEEEIVVEDLIRGRVTFDYKVFDDFIITRSDGLPTYNLVSVIDDHFMNITHVIRAEEHLSNTPRQQLIIKQLGYKVPVYAHVPMILAPDHSKLSKRHGATSVEEYKNMGIMPEALVNYLALLGWSPGEDKEIMSTEEMIELFNLEKVSKNPAIYDIKKLTWLNGYYMRTMDLEALVEKTIPFLTKEGIIPSQISSAERERVKKVIDLIRDRVKTLAEVGEACLYFFKDDFSYDEKAMRKHFQRDKTAFILGEVAKTFEKVEPFTVENVKEGLGILSNGLELSLSKINPALRLAVTGCTMGPDLFEIISFLGKEKTISRIHRAVAMGNKYSSKE
ncbi:MAG: glutamate--tRNA ligase [Dethiobacteria bacterium]|jgi:nondiscriminating glutamyl-tRNA synthetase